MLLLITLSIPFLLYPPPNELQDAAAAFVQRFEHMEEVCFRAEDMCFGGHEGLGP